MKLIKELIKFRDERDWKQFHTPRNLATALNIEAAELLDIFRWKLDDNISKEDLEDIKNEVADIYIFLQYFAEKLDINLEKEARIKVKKNRSRYEVSKSKGNATKYNKL